MAENNVQAISPTKKKHTFKPKPTNEDRNIDLRELCSIRGRSRSSTLRDVESGLIPAPFKIGMKNYWRLSDIREANDRAAQHHPCGTKCICQASESQEG